MQIKKGDNITAQTLNSFRVLEGRAEKDEHGDFGSAVWVGCCVRKKKWYIWLKWRKISREGCVVAWLSGAVSSNTLSTSGLAGCEVQLQSGLGIQKRWMFPFLQSELRDPGSRSPEYPRSPNPASQPSSYDESSRCLRPGIPGARRSPAGSPQGAGRKPWPGPLFESWPQATIYGSHQNVLPIS